ncbi:hypothetical protein COM05_29205 [Bacillus toyonensis]|uniref:serine hydrolase n=1 Tax=Bacillus toyonensis TaxID=155322 RepID=UPI000BF99B95|nr:serine hydrolase [Bacillus toyonensis]PGB76377.1 hypothetical protein COM05_29205 [Bacillus toyonensis]
MTSPFPTPYPTLLGDYPALQMCLDTAIAEALVQFPSLNPFRTAISFVAIGETTTPMDFKHAGIRYGDSDYSASLLKVGVLYAAYELKRSVNNLATESGATTSNVLFAKLHSDFDQIIKDKFHSILSSLNISINAEINSVITTPKYEQIFATVPLTTGGMALTFGGQFQTNLRQMIINSDNNAAAACIKALGYSWINGVLHAGGFFSPEGKTGIWIGGTFTGSLPYIRIPTMNDGEAAQVTTCFDMANLYAHMFQQTLVDSSSSNDMLNLLIVSAALGNDASYLDYTARSLPPRNFSVTHTKIGRGPLKTMEWVASDGAILEYLNSEGNGWKFIVVFQNSFIDNNSLTALGYIVERTMELYLFAP